MGIHSRCCRSQVGHVTKVLDHNMRCFSLRFYLLSASVQHSGGFTSRRPAEVLGGVSVGVKSTLDFTRLHRSLGGWSDIRGAMCQSHIDHVWRSRTFYRTSERPRDPAHLADIDPPAGQRTNMSLSCRSCRSCGRPPGLSAGRVCHQTFAKLLAEAGEARSRPAVGVNEAAEERAARPDAAGSGQDWRLRRLCCVPS